MSKIIKNTTINDIEIIATGVTIPASGQIDLHKQDYLIWATDDAIAEIVPYLTSGDLVVNDGIDDLTAFDGENFLKYPDTAFNVRFLAEPERGNLFVSKNVQEAIEEAKATLQGKISVLPNFFNNGNTSNKWLALDGSFNASDTIPAIINFDSAFAAITYVNSNDNSDLDIEFYRNGTGPSDLLFTWQVRGARYAYKTNNLATITLNRGDTLHCFAKRVAGGAAASSVIVTVLVQSVNSTVDEGYFPTLP